MANERIGNRYAKSLLELSKSEGISAEVASDMDAVGQILEDNENLSLALTSPIIQPSKKIKILADVFGGKVNPMTLEFFNLCIRKGRSDLIESVIHSYHKLYKIDQGISEVTVHSAVEMSEDNLNAIRSKLEKSGRVLEKVEFKKVIDPSLIGGFVLDLGDTRYDASVAGRIKSVRQKFK